MAKTAGRNFIIKIGDGAGTEAFTSIGNIRTTSLTINNSAVDSTDKDDAGWRALLAGAGVRSVTVSGTGVFADAANQDTLADLALGTAHNNFQIAEETTNDVVFEGAFQVTEFSLTGDEGDIMTYSITLESSGAVTLTNS